MSSLDPMHGVMPRAVPYGNLKALLSGGRHALASIAANNAAGGGDVILSITRTGSTSGGGALIDLQITRQGGAQVATEHKNAPSAKSEKKEKPPKPPKDAPREAAPGAPPRKPPGGVTAGKVPVDEPPKLDAAEIASCQVSQAVTPLQERVQAEAARIGLSTASFWRTQPPHA